MTKSSSTNTVITPNVPHEPITYQITTSKDDDDMLSRILLVSRRNNQILTNLDYRWCEFPWSIMLIAAAGISAVEFRGSRIRK